MMNSELNVKFDMNIGIGNMSPGMMNSGINLMNQRSGLGNVSGGSMRGKITNKKKNVIVK